MNKLGALVLCLALIIANLSMHLDKRCDSMINTKSNQISEAELAYIIDVHKTETTFCRRPLTTLIIENVALITGIGIGLSFVCVNYFLLSISALLIYRLSEKLGCNHKYASVNMVVYLLCFSNLFAFFPPVYTYDEPLQYCLIILSFIFYLDKKWIGFILTFTLALIARESTLLLVPAMAFFLLTEHNFSLKLLRSSTYLKNLIALVIPVLFYFIFTIAFVYMNDLQSATANDFSVRFTGFDINFGEPQAAAESLISFFIILGVPLYFISFISKEKKTSAQHTKFIHAFLLTLVLNSIIVLLFTKAREVRLFALPLFFIWPFFSTLFKNEIKLICNPKRYVDLFKSWKFGLYFCFLNFLNYVISFKVYKTTVGGDDYFNEYLFVVIFIVIAHFLITFYLKKQPISQNK